MILPDFILPSRINQTCQYSGIDSFEYCLDKKHFKSYPYEITYNYNSRGFRDAEWPADIDELKQAIWCIGDSFTVGLGSPLEHTWPYQISQTLNTRTINVSMDGASNQWIARKAADVINGIKPELIIIQWSYITRVELDDITLSDEDRRVHFSTDDLLAEDLENKFINLVHNLDSIKQNTKIIHSFIPNFKPEFNITKTWKQLAGKDWPNVPATLEEFKNLNKNVVNELINMFKIYDKFELYYQLYHNINYVPVICRIDLARDGHHYDILTAKNFASSVSKLLLDM